MRFLETELKGAFIIEMEPYEDHRGFFARSFCQKEFAAHGLNPRVVQCNVSFNKKKGTLRGMHYQAAPYEEAKLVRCTRGAIYDVIIDLRSKSPTFKRWIAVILTAFDIHPESYRTSLPTSRTLYPAPGSMLYIPEGFAHGFQTLEDNTELFYQMSEFYHPESARGIRWDDPAFGIEWPIPKPILSAKDQSYASFNQQRSL